MSLYNLKLEIKRKGPFVVNILTEQFWRHTAHKSYTIQEKKKENKKLMFIFFFFLGLFKMLERDIY